MILIKGQYGVEVGNAEYFRTASSLKQACNFASISSTGEKADYENVLEQTREYSGRRLWPIQYPLESGPGFNSMIDVLLMKKYSWGPDGGVPTIEEIPESEKARALKYHRALVEAAAENDETLMEKFFDEKPLTEDELRLGIRKGLIDNSIYPLFLRERRKKTWACAA